MLADKKAAIGRLFWRMLESYPNGMSDPPTEAEQQAFIMFLEANAQIYPCPDCRKAFSWIDTHPPDFTSRKHLLNWICEFHNSVNQHLGKPIYNCNLLLANSCDSCKVKIPEKLLVKKQEFAQLIY